jgi:flagellar biosynthesis/type III secretory pathway chaperone
VEADPVENLCAVVGEEARICGELVGVLREEQQAVVALRPEAILACLEQRMAVQEELLRLTADRQALVRDLAAAHHLETPSATALLLRLPPGPGQRLRARLRSLRRTLLEARGLERQNALLAGASRDSVDELLRALQALLPGTRYGADAQVASPAATERIDRHA